MSTVRLLPVLCLLVITIQGCVGPVKHEMTADFPVGVRYALGTPPVADGRVRFREIFCRIAVKEFSGLEDPRVCDDLLWRFNDEPSTPEILPLRIDRVPSFRVLIVPGFLSDCFSHIASPFEAAALELNQQGYKIESLDISGRSSSEFNAEHLAAAIDNLDLEENERLVLVGHSKGAVDILHFLVQYPGTARSVTAVVSVAGAINGSPLAYRLEDVYRDLVRKILPNRCEQGDDLALNSLHPSIRLSWLAANPLPASVLYFSIAAVTEREHMNTFLKPGYDLLSIYSPRNDGLMLLCDQIIPGAALLGFANADHWSVVLPLERKGVMVSESVRAPYAFPRKAMLQAILVYVAEAIEQGSVTF